MEQNRAAKQYRELLKKVLASEGANAMVYANGLTGGAKKKGRGNTGGAIKEKRLKSGIYSGPGYYRGSKMGNKHHYKKGNEKSRRKAMREALKAKKK